MSIDVPVLDNDTVPSPQERRYGNEFCEHVVTRVVAIQNKEPRFWIVRPQLREFSNDARVRAQPVANIYTRMRQDTFMDSRRTGIDSNYAP
jgi:hypothetical protein